MTFSAGEKLTKKLILDEIEMALKSSSPQLSDKSHTVAIIGFLTSEDIRKDKSQKIKAKAEQLLNIIYSKFPHLNAAIVFDPQKKAYLDIKTDI